MSLLPIQQIAAIAGTNRETVKKRADQLGLLPTDGEKGAKLYDSRTLVQLVPPPSKYGESDGLRETRDEAAARKDSALADKTELEVARLKGELAPVREFLEVQNAIFDKLATIVKKSPMSDNEKEDMLSVMSEAGRFWEEEP
jgi:hypothetical protein